MRKKILILYGLSILLGLLVGIIGSLLQLSINGLTSTLRAWFDFWQGYGVPIVVSSALSSMILVYIAWLLVKWGASEASGSGVQEIEGTLLHQRPIFWRRLLPVKFIGGMLAISAKMVLGREGPTIQIGGNLGEMLGEWFRMNRKRRDTLIAAGAAAGLAAAFNAPLAGVLFVLEEMRNEFNFSFTNFKSVAIATVFSTIASDLIIGAKPAISMEIFNFPPLQQLIYFFIFGIIVGFAGLLFNSSLMKSLSIMDKLSPRFHDVFVLMVGLLVGSLAVYYPETVGGGYEIIERALTITPATTFLAIVLVVRFIATLLSYNTAVPGGFFAPMLAMGTLMGTVCSVFFSWLDPTINPGMFAVAGMGALFSAAVRAPITGIILVVEMTQNYFLILPLMITCLTSTTVVQLAKNAPIYTQLLHRTLRREGINSVGG
ncbi:voltage-gated chloride channel protein (ClC-type) (plasmid) [Legionella adelaidensis]|uniref:Voltage-gated chloride channel protein (ClC-type) n=1 Tax=Legionella adelaidensis TaxID=45056 RepID=A0A0W0R4K3_9GAMM|nr:H(+)/Cl(-) exchange transporter ClcA [Legionella adelaidensis]KTC65992.1 voltage-gated chloride channel protein (ClC-type) [Legionella adelaidensis]VEH86316.1 voltage-gated chloride channel protein (ClC-type) [Legionella adelaidensis]